MALSIGANTITTVVTAQNATTKTYTVVITRTGANDTTIATFSFAALTPVVTGTVDNTAHTVALTVPYGTSPTALVSTFSIGTGASAKVGASDQVSATTANDFTNPVNYTITAQDGVTTQTYAVTVTVTHSSPTVTAVSVSSGAQAGGTAITITGTVFGGTAATSVTVVSSTSITATTPAHAPGIVNIVVTNPDTGFGTGTNLYTFNYVVGDRGPGGGIVFYVSAGF
ncbi:MAG: IPT/TIG domain-containing protein, partial [Burkholderiaceae bacterium]|nr:IPT/TIG domain-containing protein [Burkholderiaceae bacterium]